MASWFSVITQSPGPFPTFIAAAVLDHVNPPPLHAGRRAQFALVLVSGAVAAADRWEGLAWALWALALVPDASGTPGTNSAAARFCVKHKAQVRAGSFPGKAAIQRGCFDGPARQEMLFWNGIQSDVTGPFLIAMQSTPCRNKRSQNSALLVIHSVLVSLFKLRFIFSVFTSAIKTQHAWHVTATCAGAAGRHASLTALSLADHSEVHLFFAGPHVQLALAVVGGAVAAAHRLVGLHTLGWTHTLTTLGITDRPKRAVATGLV